MSRFKNPVRLLLVAACVLAVLLIPAAQATPSALDLSFGAGGKVTTALGCCGANSEAQALVRQPDGKLVVGGTAYNTVALVDFALARYNPDGSLDASFNGTGKVTTTLGFGADVVNALALQPDGKIVAAGYTYSGPDYDFALARYNPDGSLDTSFNGTGKVIASIGPHDDKADAVAVEPTGKIVVAGRSFNGLNDDFALARYNPDGSLDTSFNGTGEVVTDVGSGYDAALDLAVQPDGKLVAAGRGTDGPTEVFALARYNTDGSLDNGFGSGGKVLTAIGSFADGNALVVQPNGKLVAGGIAYAGSSFDFALARFNADGSLDSAFGSGGKVTTPIGPGQDDLIDLALQPDGRLVGAGYSDNGSNHDFALARYNPDGSLDSGFGSGGKITTGIGSGNDDAYGVAVQPDGKLVAAGPSNDGSKDVFALVRYVGHTLTVSKAGGGSGTVTSTPSGISCGSACSEPLTAPVTLTATASAGSSFAGWSGSCSGTGPCTVTTGGDRAVTARFETDKTLTLTKAGSGTGTVSSSPAGISCGTTCALAFKHGTTVTLTATASARSFFTGWSGACAGSGSCALSMNAARSVTATFKVACVVPKVKDKTLRAAKRALKRAHCSIGKVTTVFSAKVKKGRVVSELPRPGKKLTAGSKVKLKVSKGKKP